MRPALKIGCYCILLGGMMATLWYRQRANGRLETEIEMLRRQNSNLSVLQADNRRLIAEAPERTEAMRKKREELDRLQTQSIAWRKQIETLEKQREQQKRRADQEKERDLESERLESMVPLPGMMARNTLQNVGRDTPAHLFQTRAWALAHSDWQTLAETSFFPPDTLVEMNAAFSRLAPEEQAHIGSPEAMATKLAFQSSKIFILPTAVTETVIGPDEVELVPRIQISPDKINDGRPQRVRKFSDGWKYARPSATVEEKKAMIDATPPTQREMLGKT